MASSETICLNLESKFNLEDLFFSTTDHRGVIRYGNAVFVRVSGYSQEELIGQAHSKIRHPDMPCSVFRLFWDTLQAGETIAAYVKNRSKNGSYYWVMAVATPIDGGYLSVRLKPTSDLLPKIVETYQAVRALEQSAADERFSKDEVINLGMSHLLGVINRMGFADYPTFMRHALAAEMSARHECLSATKLGVANSPYDNNTTSARADIVGLRLANERSDMILGNTLRKLSTLKSVNRTFLTIANKMLRESESIRMVALNAKVAANNSTLQAISEALAESECENRNVLSAMSESVKTLAASLDHLAFDISVAALQGEICSHFLQELCEDQRDLSVQAYENVTILLHESGNRIQRMCDRLASAHTWFIQLESQVERLHRNARTIRFVRMAGVIESALLDVGHTFRGLFDSVDTHIRDTLENCSHLRANVKSGKEAIHNLIEAKSLIESEMETLRRGREQFVS